MTSPNGNTPLDMAALAARAVGYRPMQMSPTDVRANATRRRAERQMVACPTVMDAEEPGTPEAIEAMKMATCVVAATLERHTGQPPTASTALNEAKGIIGAYLRHYLHTATRSHDCTGHGGKVD